MKRILVVAGIIVTALIVAATAGPTSGLAADGTVKVGVIEMLTGGSAFYGNAVLEGIKVAEAEINASGGINGKKVQLAVMDNASDNAQAAALTAQLASDKSIPVGITPTYQPNFNAACARANAAGFPMVSAQAEVRDGVRSGQRLRGLPASEHPGIGEGRGSGLAGGRRGRRDERLRPADHPGEECQR